MLELVKFTSVDITVDPIEFNTGNLPIKEWRVTRELRCTKRTKMRRHATWPAFTYAGEAQIHMVCDILEDTTEDYSATRLLINRTILGDLTAIPTDRKFGILQLKYYGMTETMSGDVTLDSSGPEMPLQGAMPTVSELSIVWVVFQSYMLGDTSGDPYIF